MPVKICLIGKRFGRLLVVDDAQSIRTNPGRNYRTRSKCVCDCGAVVLVCNQELRTGDTKSCGCFLRDTLAEVTHGHSPRGKPTRTYICWAHIKARCFNPKDHHFPIYGGRGIAVCERWLNFENFLADMGEKPQGMTIERIDNNKDYEPGNCRWATTKEQNRNKRNNRIVTVRGVTGCLAALSEKFGVSTAIVRDRLNYGWGAESAFFTPKKQLIPNPK